MDRCSFVMPARDPASCGIRDRARDFSVPQTDHAAWVGRRSQECYPAEPFQAVAASRRDVR